METSRWAWFFFSFYFVLQVKANDVLIVTEGEPFNITCNYGLPGYWTIHPLLVNTEGQGECTERNGVTYYQCRINRAQLTDAGNYTFSILSSANPGTQLDICHVQITVQPIEESTTTTDLTSSIAATIQPTSSGLFYYTSSSPPITSSYRLSTTSIIVLSSSSTITTTEGTNTVSSGSLPHSTIIGASIGIGLAGILIILILFIVISISIYLAITRRQTYSPESADLSTSADQPPATIVTANKSIDINDNIFYANKSAVATSEIPHCQTDQGNICSKEDGTVNTYDEVTTTDDKDTVTETTNTCDEIATSQMTANKNSSVVTPPLDGSVADKDQVTDAIEDVPTTLNTIDDAQEDYDCETTF